MPFLLPALVAAGAAIGIQGIAVGFANLSLTFVLTSIATNVALAGLAYALQPEPQKNNTAGQLRDRQQMIRSSISPHDLIFGEALKSGTMLFADSRNGYMYFAIAFAAAKITAFDDFYFDDNLVGARDANGDVTAGRYAGFCRIQVALGDPNATANAWWVSELPDKWTVNHRERGRAVAYIRLLRNDDIYPTGIPNVRAILRGHALFDPRDAGTRYSNNPALVARYWLTSIYGARSPDDEILDDLVIAAANICEERVTMAAYLSSAVTVNPTTNLLSFAAAEETIDSGDGVKVTSTGTLPGGISAGVTYYVLRVAAGTYLCTSYRNTLDHVPIDLTSAGTGTIRLSHVDQPRYTCDGVVDSSRSWPEVLEEILSSMAGRYSDALGKHNLFAGAYVTPAVDFDEDDLRGSVDLLAHLRLQDSCNTVRGVYVEPRRDWQATDFPPVTNVLYVDEDNGETYEHDLTLAMTRGSVRAQRLAKIDLEANRQGITVTLPLQPSARALSLVSGETFRLSLHAAGWVDKVFRVESWGFGPDGSIDIGAREEAAAVYAWNGGEATALDPAPDTNLPDPFTQPAPTALDLQSGTAHLLIGGDGTVISRLHVGWTLPTGDYQLGTEIQYRIAGETNWQSALVGDRTLTQAYVTGVVDGAVYNVRIRAYSTLGVRSAWLGYPDASGIHTVQGKSAPPSAVASLTAAINAAGVLLTWPAITDADADLYELRVGAAWDTAASLMQDRRLNYQTGLLTAGTYAFRVRAIDTTGNYSATDAVASVTISAPSALTLSGAIAAADYQLTWSTAAASFLIDRYEIRQGASFATGVLVATTYSTALKKPVDWSGARTFWVAAIDVAGNVGTASSVTLSVVVAAAPVVSSSFVGRDAVLSWTIPASGLPIEQYEVRYGADFASGISLGKIKSTVLNVAVTWSGSRLFWVAAIDTAGGVGLSGSVNVALVLPGAPSIAPKVANNQVELSWTDAPGSLPIGRDEIRRGSTFAGANSLGYITGTVTSLFELLAGTYTYWIVSYDTAGNQGVPNSVSLALANPPNLQVFESINSSFGGTFVNASIEDGDVVFPHDTTKSRHQKFLDGGWATIDAKIAAGFDSFLEPSTTSGYYEETIDHGSSISLVNVTVSATTHVIDGAPTFAGTISYKVNVGDAWTDVAGFTATSITGRYFKVRVTCSSSGADDLGALDVLQILISKAV